LFVETPRKFITAIYLYLKEKNYYTITIHLV
jgi:hypothetical protein